MFTGKALGFERKYSSVIAIAIQAFAFVRLWWAVIKTKTLEHVKGSASAKQKQNPCFGNREIVEMECHCKCSHGFCCSRDARCFSNGPRKINQPSGVPWVSSAPSLKRILPTSHSNPVQFCQFSACRCASSCLFSVFKPDIRMEAEHFCIFLRDFIFSNASAHF